MEQLFNKLTAITKEFYLPAFNDMITVEPSPFLEAIKKSALPTGGNIVGAARYGLNGGFGMGDEDSATPTAFPQLYKNLKATAKDMYCDIKISDKTVKLADGKGGSIFDAYAEEFKGAYEAAKWNVGRMLFGKGDGVLASFASAISDANNFTADNVNNLIEGLAVDIYEDNSGTITLNTTYSPARIVYIDGATKKVYLDKKVTTTYKGFITVQGSYKKEITGLGAIFDTTSASIYGVTRSGNEWVNPLTFDANHALSTADLYDVISDAKRKRHTNIDMILMGDAAFRAWHEYMESTHYTVTPTTLKYKSGAVGFEVVVGQQTAVIVNEPFVPTAEAWCVEKANFEFFSTPWDFADMQTGGAFTLVPGTHNYRALLASYGELMCKNPGGCVQITNCDESST